MRIPGGDEDRFDDEFGVQDSILSIVGTPTYIHRKFPQASCQGAKEN